MFSTWKDFILFAYFNKEDLLKPNVVIHCGFQLLFGSLHKRILNSFTRGEGNIGNIGSYRLTCIIICKVNQCNKH